MSAPDTNIDKQVKRHRPSLAGIALALGVILVIVIGVALTQTEEDAAPNVNSTATTADQ